ncbi:MAG: rhodanese-like domain-containing protein [Acidobacteria bacterium]|nr:rhodanese-like domain-containing protein [Acidobacteriota bacterium]
MYKTITPPDAKALHDAGGYHLVDVRTEGEFSEGHAVGAVNVPFAHAGPGGMQPNPDFLRTIQANFPPDANLVLNCKGGGRSARACALLAENGYSNLFNVDGGYVGRFDPSGKVVQPGWSMCDLPSTTDAGPDASYTTLLAKTAEC